MTYIPPVEEQKILNSEGTIINPSTENTLLLINNLIETLQETNRRLSSIGSAINSGQPALRVQQINPPSTAVTGPLTDAQNTAANLILMRNAPLYDGLNAIHANINNIKIT